MLVTIQQAARHLRLDDLEDQEVFEDLEDKCLQVSHMVMDYLKIADLDRWQSPTGEPQDVPPLVQAATLIWLGILWKHRDGESDETLQLGFIPKSVSNILWRYRSPSYA